MPRLSVTLSDVVHAQLSSIAAGNKVSIACVVNQLIQLGMKHIDSNINEPTVVEKHCQQLIIQMNALIKNLSAEILKFEQADFDKLRDATNIKHNELLTQQN